MSNSPYGTCNSPCSEVIGIAYGTAKVRAVLAAVRGGMVDSLVTHSTLATALIEAASIETAG